MGALAAAVLASAAPRAGAPVLAAAFPSDVGDAGRLSGHSGGRLRRRRDARRRDPDLVRLGRLARDPAADVHGGAGGAHRARRRPSRPAAAVRAGDRRQGRVREARRRRRPRRPARRGPVPGRRAGAAGVDRGRLPRRHRRQPARPGGGRVQRAGPGARLRGLVGELGPRQAGSRVLRPDRRRSCGSRPTRSPTSATASTTTSVRPRPPGWSRSSSAAGPGAGSRPAGPIRPRRLRRSRA